jgi:hypothetical protein
MTRVYELRHEEISSRLYDSPEPHRDCLVLGSGRSGTSLMAELLSSAKYDLGPCLHGPSAMNPHGFFEDADTGLINEELLRPYVGSAAPRPRSADHSRLRSLAEGEAWLAALPPDIEIAAAPDVTSRIRAATRSRPFCRKDPRFAYTLPVWMPYLRDPALICVFREPARTARSICAFMAAENVDVNFGEAVRIWTAHYERILDRLTPEGEWFIIHYEQLMRGDALPRLERRLGIRCDRSVCDPALRRTAVEGAVGKRAEALYGQLCTAAGYVD